ncbi:hotdog fold thioesterase [Falsarthrobacter nasiphocae]|uniref:Acyl-CoA thioesterase n=1 Tax=Falsarthrobacter nasiphocae TaxID=189863 RepID=A0AAE3YHS8_9MICC|nr:hotdog fold thioesterase [Falsarthrobacter nasiphocae]MDR6892399.1 acyl-CoA thioesterase [Falsarthrobacter nasiphocae]
MTEQHSPEPGAAPRSDPTPTSPEPVHPEQGPTPHSPGIEMAPGLEPHPMLAGDAASAWMGLRVEDYAPGRAVCSLIPRPEMLNGFGIGHGGMTFALADTAFAIACNDASDHETYTVAQGVDINFLAPVTPGARLRATAERASRPGRSAVFDVTVEQESEGGPVVVALFRGRSRTLPRAGR